MKSLVRTARYAAILIATLIFASVCFAQEADVIRNVNLRSDPSTSQPSIRLLSPAEKLTLVDPGTENGYYHVLTQQGEDGWVWGRNVHIETVASASTTSPVSSIPTGSSIVSVDWDKPDPVTGNFQAEDGTCGPDGNDVDTPTNLRKNRTDVPASYHEIPFEAISTLPFPRPAPTRRVNWSSQQLAQIQPYEGIAISVVGYIAAVKPEGAESTNCGFVKASEIDWHIPLVKQPGLGEPNAIVVEATPRVKVSHPKWTQTSLTQLKVNKTPVRISGWLMFDPDHPNHLGKYRITLWEIHPITKIEASVDGEWVDLDQ